MSDHVSAIQFRVRYAETDQMGMAHHANYLVWCEQARTEHMRVLGVSYRDLEASGVLPPVVEASLRYRTAAQYDDLVQVRCWVRETSSRRVTFGYIVERAEDGALLATASTSLIAIDANRSIQRLPKGIREKLIAVSDPVRL